MATTPEDIPSIPPFLVFRDYQRFVACPYSHFGNLCLRTRRPCNTGYHCSLEFEERSGTATAAAVIGGMIFSPAGMMIAAGTSKRSQLKFIIPYTKAYLISPALLVTLILAGLMTIAAQGLFLHLLNEMTIGSGVAYFLVLGFIMTVVLIPVSMLTSYCFPNHLKLSPLSRRGEWGWASVYHQNYYEILPPWPGLKAANHILEHLQKTLQATSYEEYLESFTYFYQLCLHFKIPAPQPTELCTLDEVTHQQLIEDWKERLPRLHAQPIVSAELEEILGKPKTPAKNLEAIEAKAGDTTESSVQIQVDPGQHVWQDGDCLVVHDESILPGDCPFAESTEKSRKFSLSFGVKESPLGRFYLWFPFGPWIVNRFDTIELELDVPLSNSALRKRQEFQERAKARFRVMLIFIVVFLVSGITARITMPELLSRPEARILMMVFVAIIGLHYVSHRRLLLKQQLLHIKKRRGEYFFLTGAPYSYLERFPKYHRNHTQKMKTTSAANPNNEVSNQT